MAKLTDYVREGFTRRRRPWDGGELPEWWGVLVWAALAAICGMLLLGALFDPGGSSGAAPHRPAYAVQTLDPYAPPGAPGTTAGPVPSGSPAPSGSATAGPPSAGFSATAPVQLARTGGGTAVVPAGARDVARAAARARATGSWAGIPLIGGGKPPSASPTPDGTVIGDVTVADPASTGDSTYVFSAMITHGPAERPAAVQVTVGRTVNGYAVLAR